VIWIVKWLLYDIGEDTNFGPPCLDAHDYSAFDSACRSGNLQIIRLLYEYSKEKLIDRIVGDINNAFKICCQMGWMSLIKWLIEMKTNKVLDFVELDIHNNNESPFTAACQRGHLNVAMYLIELGQDLTFGQINIHASDDMPFKYACRYQFLDVAEFLFEF